MLMGNATRLKAALQDVEDNAESNSSRFSKEVAAAIPRLRSDILAARNAAEDAYVHSVDSDPTEAIKMLTALQSRVAELTDRAKRYTRYQEILRLQVTTYDALDELRGDVNTKLKVWTALRDWEAVTATWLATPINDIVAEDIEKQVSQYMKTAIQGDRALAGNPVVTKLKALVTEFKATLPIVVNLRCLALKRRHWVQIHKILGYEIKVGPRRQDGVFALRPSVCWFAGR
jgi:dynein heavy chain, axonemal